MISRGRAAGLEEAQHQLVVRMIVLMTEVLSVKVHDHDNHRLLSDIDNGFCNNTIDTIE